jgi:hypothetical protein
MPAIHLDRLEQQLNLIFNPETSGVLFKENFLTLIEAHSNLAYQAGQDLQRKSLTPKLHLPPILMHRVQLRLVSLSKKNPELAIEYAEQLWSINTYETKLFAAIIIGNVSEVLRNDVLERLLKWGMETTDYEVHQLLFINGSKKIRQINQNIWLESLITWIDSNDQNQIVIAISAIRALINDPNFVNLPRIFKIIFPLFTNASRKVNAALQILINDLAEINPNETAHFLSSVLLSSPPKVTRQIIRKSLNLFPDKQKLILRNSLLSVSEDDLDA